MSDESNDGFRVNNKPTGLGLGEDPNARAERVEIERLNGLLLEYAEHGPPHATRMRFALRALRDLVEAVDYDDPADDEGPGKRGGMIEAALTTARELLGDRDRDLDAALDNEARWRDQ